MTEAQPQPSTTNEIEELKAKIAELENKINKKSKKPKREYTPCECSECKKTFKNQFILATHMRTIHNKDRPTFPCPHCGKQLKSKYYLQKHISVIHADELKMKEEKEQTTTDETPAWANLMLDETKKIESD